MVAAISYAHLVGFHDVVQKEKLSNVDWVQTITVNSDEVITVFRTTLQEKVKITCIMAKIRDVISPEND